MLEIIKARIKEGSSLVALSVLITQGSLLLPGMERLQTVLVIAAIGCAVAGFLAKDSANGS